MRFYNMQKIKFRHLLWCIFGISLFVVGGCAITTTYGKSPKQDIVDRDVFTFKIFYNSFANQQDIDLKAKEEIKKFMDEHGYEDDALQNFKCGYNIVRWSSYCTYQVKFYASTQDSSTKDAYGAGLILGSSLASKHYSYKGSAYIENECNELISNYLGSSSNSGGFIQGCINGYKDAFGRR